MRMDRKVAVADSLETESLIDSVLVHVGCNWGARLIELWTLSGGDLVDVGTGGDHDSVGGLEECDVFFDDRGCCFRGGGGDWFLGVGIARAGASIGRKRVGQ